jgi:hypothetical protein
MKKTPEKKKTASEPVKNSGRGVVAKKENGEFSSQLPKTLRLKKLLYLGMKNNRCFISKAVKFANCSRQAFYDIYNNDDEFRSQIDELTENKIDTMEELLENKSKIDTVANIYWLKCKGRKRGWNEHITIDVTPEGVLVPNHIIDEAVENAFRAERERLNNAQ